MTPQQQQNRAMRREQVERCLAADMTVKEWCGLNNVGELRFYVDRKILSGDEGPHDSGRWRNCPAHLAVSDKQEPSVCMMEMCRNHRQGRWRAASGPEQ